MVADINDRSYPVDGAPFTRMMSGHPPGMTWNYIADVDGEPAACLQIYPVEGDACVMLVATLPEARGRGLCARLMHRALWDARAAGCDVSTLQATKPGKPIYAKLGYRDEGALEMWEKRR